MPPRCRRQLFVALMTLAAVVAPGGVQSAAAQAHLTGEWATLPTLMPINPIHAAVLRTGKVLVIAGSENDPTITEYRVALFDPATGGTSVQSVPWDLFCNALSLLPDGRALVVGGTLQYDPFRGLKTTTIFDPLTEKLIQVQDMAHGRWYPTNTVLADGGTMTFSGLSETGSTNRAVEIYDVPAGWGPESIAPWTPPLYPWPHLLPNGRVFVSGPNIDSHVLDPTTMTWTLNVARTNYTRRRTFGSSVLLPLLPERNYQPRVMILGGDNPATASAEVIDLSQTAPSWRSLPPMSAPRIELNAVLLPTGRVLALGGSAQDNVASTASLGADLFDPETETWTPAGVARYPRLYHSVGLLLPDATVWTAGSNPSRGTWEPHMEIYRPAYLFTTDAGGNVVPATRPTITGAPTTIGYGAAFQVSTPNAADIAQVVLVRPAATTHAFDMEQRLVGMTFTRGAGSLTAVAPPGPTVAPPGYYMLFLIDARGVPSVARFVQLSPHPTNQPPRGSIVSPGADVTVAVGGMVTFAGDGTDTDGTVTQFSWVIPGGSPGVSAARNPGSVVFSTPGTYAASLTVADDLGVNDPSPPTRTIAVVEAPTFTLSVTRQGAGSGTVSSSPAGIVCGSTCSSTYTGGTLVTLTATPAPGSRFDGWSGAADCADGVVTLNQNTTCTATFAVVQASSFTLSVTRQGTGSGTVTSSPAGIDCGSTCSSTYTDGTIVALTATAATGSRFDGWSGAADCTDGVVTLNQNTTCTATFTSVGNATLKVGRTGKGSGTITSSPAGITCGSDCSQTYPIGTEVRLTATPAPGSAFDGWTGDADCADGLVRMTSSKTCKARFRR